MYERLRACPGGSRALKLRRGTAERLCDRSIAERSWPVATERWNHPARGVALFPFAGELQGALADGFAEGLVRREGGEPFGPRVALGSQEVKQTQCLTLR